MTLGWGLRFSISNNLLGDTDAAASATTVVSRTFKEFEDLEVPLNHQNKNLIHSVLIIFYCFPVLWESVYYIFHLKYFINYNTECTKIFYSFTQAGLWSAYCQKNLKEFCLQSKSNLDIVRIIFQTLRESNDDINLRKTC